MIYAGVLFATLVAAGFLLRGRITARTGPERSASPSLAFADALRHPAFRAALTANFVNGWTVYGVRIALVPLLVVEVLRQPSAWAGPALTAFATGTAATLLMGGMVADRRGRRLPVLVGSATVAITSAWLGFTTTLTGLLAASFLSGAGTGLMSPAVNASVGDVIAAKGRDVDGGRVLAGFQMVGDVGAVTGPVLAGVVAETVGYSTAFALTAVIAAVSFVSWLHAPETLPR